MSQNEVAFVSGHDTCSAWHFAADGSSRPVVVMAHGFGGTKDSGLAPFGGRLAAAGFDVLAFDFRGFGASEGSPRQHVSVRRQLDDYHAAIDAAKALDGVDPDRVALWGVSFSGGHVIRVAAERSDVRAVISLTPLTNGLAVSRAAAATRSAAASASATMTGLRSRISMRRGRSPLMMPLVAPSGDSAALALSGTYEAYTALAGPTWRNEIDGAVGLEALSIRTTAAAKRLSCPLLVQIADFDRYIPADSAAATAAHGRATVHHYPCDHFDVWPGRAWFDKTVCDQVAFLARVLRTQRSDPV